jgi:hypothetical protein
MTDTRDAKRLPGLDTARDLPRHRRNGRDPDRVVRERACVPGMKEMGWKETRTRIFESEKVGVPRTMKRRDVPIDDGQRFDATLP